MSIVVLTAAHLLFARREVKTDVRFGSRLCENAMQIFRKTR